MKWLVFKKELCIYTIFYREERNFTQTLRREQDAAYLESLRADQEKVFKFV
jgi:hypothetical protein